MKKRIAFDMSSFCWRGLLAGQDKENGRKVMHEEKQVLINSAIYGYENVMNLMLKVVEDQKLVPINCILVFEGMNSKAKRQLISNQYKANSKKVPEQYEEFHKLKEMLSELWLGLGAQCMAQDFAEGDDTLAWLAMHTEDDLLIATYDNDLTSLNGTNAYGGTTEVWIDQLIGCNKYGAFDCHLVTTYKALVGDASDNIKGVKGFGPAAFDKYVEAYGYDGLQELHDMFVRSDLSPLAECDDKLLKMIWDQAPAAQNSFDLARLRPQWVNTMKHPLQWQPGMVRQLRADDDHRLKKWYGRSRLVTGDLFDEAVRWALPLIEASEEVMLDIETSSSDESDAWLEAQGNADGVDVFGSTLTGLGLTFGKNNQFSLYFSVDHADTVNCSSEKLRQFIAMIDKPLVIANVSFELTVLHNAWGAKQKNNGFHGFLPNVLDTMLEGSYTDENTPRGLKQRSLALLKYEQQSYDETTRLVGFERDLFPGGRLLTETEPTYETKTVGTGKFEPLFDDTGAPIGHGLELTKEVVVLVDGEPVIKAPPIQTRRYKMNELPATHVVGYGLDDTICTAALHNYYKLFMQLEHTWGVYLEVEIDAAYQHAKNFIDGFDISIEKLNSLSAEDDITYNNAWKVLRTFLMEKGWAGTVPPAYTADITAAQVKEAFEIVHGCKMDTQMRNIDKLVKFARIEDKPIFAGLLEDMVFDTGVDADEATEKFNNYVQSFFKGEPQFNDGSPLQMQNLLYTVMGLPIRVRNKPTETMRNAGIFEGSPKTDTLAIAYALQECTPEQKEVLNAIKLLGMVGTRRSLFYSKYPYFPHWKDGKIRSSHNQSAANTRRATSSKPNMQQMPKHAKIEGQEAKFREVVVPHHPDAVIVSMDFDSQEMVLIAEQSQDPNMLSCFVGDDRRSPHTITGLGIVRLEQGFDWSYEEFVEALKSKEHPQHKFAYDGRILGKKVNFTAEYLAMAPKVAATLLVTEEKAQMFLDAREAMFAVAGAWKQGKIAEAKEFGIVRTMMGAVRHLAPAFTSGDRWKASKAERQAVNFSVQGPAAEQTKLAEGRMWKDNLFFDFDAVCIGPIHDEVVASVMIADLPEFLPRMHRCMVAKYANMAITPVSTISFGKDFYRQIEIGDTPTPEAIAAGLKKMYEKILEREAA
jgi:DNA polymerase I-like protein with 3'-5' exonuclease and polymerase domains/5'-3' exonuclease